MTRYTFTGEQLYTAGFTRLCSIIPPGAALSPNSKIPSDQCGKIPGKQNNNGHWYGYDWASAEPTAEQVDRWDGCGAGIGLVCGVGDNPVVGIDIDVTDADVSAYVHNLAVSVLGAAPMRTGRRPKRMLAYQLDLLSAPVTWRKLKFKLRGDGQEHLVEIRGKGQQFVAAGVHPDTHKPYTWDTDLSAAGIDGLPAIDSDDLDVFFTRLAAWVEEEGGAVLASATGAGGQDRSAVDQARLAADDLDWMDRVVDNLPNGADDYPTRDDYIRVGCAIKAAYAADVPRGAAAFARWCDRWAGGDNDPATVAADWDRMKPPFEVGCGWLEEQARLKGGFNAAEAVFEPSPHSEPLSDTPTDNDRQSATETGSADGAGEGEFWRRYCWIEGLKRFADLTTGALLDKEQFNDRWAGRVGSAVSGLNSPAGVYMQYASRRIVAGVTYRPGLGRFVDEADGRMLNTWQPGPAHGARGEHWAKHTASSKDVGPWLDLVRRLVPDKRERKILLDWLAWQIQHPGEKCNWHPLLWGEQGIGKDTLLVPLVRGLGDSRRGNAATVQANELAGDWTDWYENKSLVVIEEINSFDRRSIAEKLKPMLTNPPYTLRINKKYLLPHDVPNVANFVFLSNHGDALPLEGSDRRSFVIHAAVRKAEFPDGYFEDLYDWLDLGGDMFVCGWLAGRDLSGFAGKGDAPKTDAKETMRREGLGVVESILLSAIEDEADIFERDLFLMDEVVAYVRQQTGGLRISPHKISRIMQDFGAVKLGRNRIDGKREYVWAVRRVDTYLAEAGEPGKLGRMLEKQRRDAAASRAEGMFKERGG